MKARIGWWLVIGVLLSSVTCQLGIPNLKVELNTPSPEPGPPQLTALPRAVTVITGQPQVVEIVPRQTAPAAGEILPQQPAQVVLDPSVVKQLNAAVERNPELGGLFWSDDDQDGKDDYVYVEFPTQYPVEDVKLFTSIDFADEGGGQFSQTYWIILSNHSPEKQDFELIATVPPEFSKNAEELIFDPQPDHIRASASGLELTYSVSLGIKEESHHGSTVLASYFPEGQSSVRPQERDHITSMRVRKKEQIGVQDMTEAEERVLLLAFPERARRCQALSEPDRSGCFAAMAEDYKDRLELADRTTLCNEIQDGWWRQGCLAVVSRNGNPCSAEGLTEEQVDLCKAYFVGGVCKDRFLEIDIDCAMREAIKNKAALACTYLVDRDLHNDCLARTTGNPAACENIINRERRESCQREVKLPEQTNPDSVFNPPPGVNQPGYMPPPTQQATPVAESTAPSGPPTPVAVDASKLNNEFWAKVNAEVADCNAQNCANHRNYSGCAMDCRGIGGFFGSALYNNYFLTLHKDYEPRANHVADYLLGNLEACNDPFVTSQANDRGAIYGACIKKFNDEGMRLLEIAWDDTCAVWCSEQGKTGRADGVPRSCVCE